MLGKNLEAAYSTVSKWFRVSFILNLLLLLVILMLGVVLIRQENTTVVVPMGFNSTLTVSNNNVSPEYLETITRFFLSNFLDLTPNNIEDKQAEVLKYVDPRGYQKINEGFMEAKKKYKENTLATIFNLESLKLDTKKLTAKAKGKIISFFGKEGKTSDEVEIDIKYNYQNGVPKLLKFFVSKKDENK